MKNNSRSLMKKASLIAVLATCSFSTCLAQALPAGANPRQIKSIIVELKVPQTTWFKLNGMAIGDRPKLAALLLSSDQKEIVDTSNITTTDGSPATLDITSAVPFTTGMPPVAHNLSIGKKTTLLAKINLKTQINITVSITSTELTKDTALERLAPSTNTISMSASCDVVSGQATVLDSMPPSGTEPISVFLVTSTVLPST